MVNSEISEQSFEKRSRNSGISIILWSLAWAGSLIVVDKAALYGWWDSQAITMTAIAFNALLGAGLVSSYVRFLRGSDELQRKIQLDALAVSMGVTLVATITYFLLVTWGFIGDEEVTDIFLIMIVAYVASVLAGMWRYR